jgi:hypothetical protein
MRRRLTAMPKCGIGRRQCSGFRRWRRKSRLT